MTERQQPGEADQQIEGAGEQREAQQLHQEYRVAEERRRQRDGQCNGVQDFLVHAYFSFPNRPAGRSSSTMTITTNTTTSEPSG